MVQPSTKRSNIRSSIEDEQTTMIACISTQSSSSSDETDAEIESGSEDDVSPRHRRLSSCDEDESLEIPPVFSLAVDKALIKRTSTLPVTPNFPSKISVTSIKTIYCYEIEDSTGLPKSMSMSTSSNGVAILVMKNDGGGGGDTSSGGGVGGSGSGSGSPSVGGGGGGGNGVVSAGGSGAGGNGNGGGGGGHGNGNGNDNTGGGSSGDSVNSVNVASSTQSSNSTRNSGKSSDVSCCSMLVGTGRRGETGFSVDRNQNSDHPAGQANPFIHSVYNVEFDRDGNNNKGNGNGRKQIDTRAASLGSYTSSQSQQSFSYSITAYLRISSMKHTHPLTNYSSSFISHPFQRMHL